MKSEVLTIKTSQRKEIVDITHPVHDWLDKQNVTDGILNLFINHTTAALTTADLDPGTDEDMLDAFEHMVPKLKYRHPHDPSHVTDHILSSLIGTSLTLPVKKRIVVLGTWQRIVLVELDGPRNRKIIVTVTS